MYHTLKYNNNDIVCVYRLQINRIYILTIMANISAGIDNASVIKNPPRKINVMIASNRAAKALPVWLARGGATTTFEC